MIYGREVWLDKRVNARHGSGVFNLGKKYASNNNKPT